MLQAEAVMQSPDYPSFCMKPATGEWVIVNPLNPSGPALGYGQMSADELRNITMGDAQTLPALPDNLISWLDMLDDAQAYLELHPEYALTEQDRQLMLPAMAVEPIMPEIQWNQDAPYNDMVPKGCPTGCVATALSQIMYFYHYPEQGIGSHGYKWQDTTLYVNFAEQTYDWDLMFDAYNRYQHTDEQKAEVAKLNYHVGVAMDMGYGPNASGAYDMRVNEQMTNYFGYNKYATVLNRSSFGLVSWTSALNRELSLGHPVYMSGYSDSGGHAFVLDGVNAEGYYHVNWGWGGYYNGWFDISVMKPEGYGAGASESDDGFAWGQMIYAGFTPDVPADSIYYPTVQNYYIDAVVVGDTITSNIWFLNTGATTQKGEIFFDLMQGDELIDRQLVIEKDSYRYWREKGQSVQYVLPEGLADGEYRIAMSFRQEDGFWGTIHGYRPSPDGINVWVEDGVPSVSASDIAVRMQLEEWSYDADIYAGRKSSIKALIRNVGQETVAGLWYLALNPGTEYQEEFPAQRIVTIAPQETKWVEFKPVFSAIGPCSMGIGVFRQCEDDMTLWEVANSLVDIEVLNDGTFGSAISLTGEPYIESGDCEVNGTIYMAVPLFNDALPYNGEVEIRFFSDQKQSKEAFSAMADCAVESQEEKTQIVPILLSEAKAKKSYYGSAYIRRGDDYIKLEGSANKFKINVYEEGHAAGIEAVEADGSQAPAVRRDLFGRPLSNGSHTGFEIREGRVIMIQ